MDWSQIITGAIVASINGVAVMLATKFVSKALSRSDRRRSDEEEVHKDGGTNGKE